MLWVACACLVASCGSPAHPPGLVDVEGGLVNGPRIDACVDDAAVAPSPGAEGLCGQYFLGATGDPPNLYFVIDRSGSMGELVDGREKYSAVAGAAVALVRSLGSKAKVGAAVFPGRHVSDSQQCVVGEEVFASTLGDTVLGTACDPDGPVTRAFSAAISLPNNAPPVGATPTAATLASLLPVLAALPGRTAVILATDGGPNCNGAASCDETKCIVNIEGRCDPGGNCCDRSIYGPEAPKNCLDEGPTRAAVQALHAQGIKTYVVGVPGSSPYAALLDELAVDGATARLGATAYYDVEHVSELDGVLDSIGATVILSCHLHLTEMPPDHGLVNVYLDSRVLTYGSPDGWRWTGDADVEAGTTAEGGSATEGGDPGDASTESAPSAASYLDLDLTGKACSDLEAGQVRRLEITFGCKTEIVR